MLALAGDFLYGRKRSDGMLDLTDRGWGSVEEGKAGWAERGGTPTPSWVTGDVTKGEVCLSGSAQITRPRRLSKLKSRGGDGGELRGGKRVVEPADSQWRWGIARQPHIPTKSLCNKWQHLFPTAGSEGSQPSQMIEKSYSPVCCNNVVFSLYWHHTLTV